MSQLQQQQQTAFAGNQAALGALSTAWSPVLSSGMVPYGYSPGLDSMLKSNIVNQGATDTTNSENASRLQQLQKSGGAPGAVAPGSQAAIDAEIETKGQQGTAANLTNEKIAGYDQGLKNLEGGTTAELGIANAENETGLAGASTSAGNLGVDTAAESWKQGQTSSPGAILGDITGAASSLAKTITNPAGYSSA
jgi:hypothetical protein